MITFEVTWRTRVSDEEFSNIHTVRTIFFSGMLIHTFHAERDDNNNEK